MIGELALMSFFPAQIKVIFVTGGSMIYLAGSKGNLYGCLSLHL
jgi:hypothetical protein